MNHEESNMSTVEIPKSTKPKIYDYYIVKLLERPSLYVPDHLFVCVPFGWLGDINYKYNSIKVAYPAVEDNSLTQERVKKKHTIRKNWVTVDGALQCGADTYAEAQNYLEEFINPIVKPFNNTYMTTSLLDQERSSPLLENNLLGNIRKQVNDIKNELDETPANQTSERTKESWTKDELTDIIEVETEIQDITKNSLTGMSDYEFDTEPISSLGNTDESNTYQEDNTCNSIHFAKPLEEISQGEMDILCRIHDEIIKVNMAWKLALEIIEEVPDAAFYMMDSLNKCFECLQVTKHMKNESNDEKYQQSVHKEDIGVHKEVKGVKRKCLTGKRKNYKAIDVR